MNKYNYHEHIYDEDCNELARLSLVDDEWSVDFPDCGRMDILELKKHLVTEVFPRILNEILEDVK